MSDSVLFLRAQTPLHLGTGSSVGAIDLPIQRERHTGWPMGQSSGVRGVLRDLFRCYLMEHCAVASYELADSDLRTVRLFGPARYEQGSGAPGGFTLTDARIAAFPVRAGTSTFALLVCADLMNRVAEDLALAGHTAPWGASVPDIADSEALTPAEQPMAELVLDDMVLACRSENEPGAVSHYAAWLGGSGARPARVAQVSNMVFGHEARFATEIVTGDRFTQELLPTESVLYSLLLAREGLGDLPEAIQWRRQVQIGAEKALCQGRCWATLVPGAGHGYA